MLCENCKWVHTCATQRLACEPYYIFVEKGELVNLEKVPSTFWYNRAFEVNTSWKRIDYEIYDEIASTEGTQKALQKMGVPVKYKAPFRRAAEKYSQDIFKQKLKDLK